MSPRQLEYFLEIYSQKSIKKTAEKLIISPQALSKTLKEIEDELQVKLFIRGKKELEPTVEAEYLKNHAIKILQEYDKINNLKSYTEHQNSVLTIYSIDGFLEFVSIKFIEDFNKSYPNILLNIVENTEKDIIEKLKKREINTAILTKTLESDTFSSHYLYSNKNCLIINKENPLAKKHIISQSDLHNQPLAGKGSNYSCYTSNIARLFERNINPKVILETTNDSLIINMAEKNLAIGITLDFIAHNHKSDNIVIREFTEDNQYRNMFWVENTFSIITKEEKYFKNFLLTWLEENKEILFNN